MIQQESLTKCKDLWRKILTYANGLPWVLWFWKWAIFCHFFVAWLHFVFSNLMLSFTRIYIHISRWEMSQIFFLVNSLWLQVLGLFFATVLRAVSASTQRDYAIDEDYLAASSSRQPVANRQPIQAATPNSTPGAPSEARSPKNDAWSTRMRDKVLESWPSCYMSCITTQSSLISLSFHSISFHRMANFMATFGLKEAFAIQTWTHFTCK